jgi:hypothetical protein
MPDGRARRGKKPVGVAYPLNRIKARRCRCEKMGGQSVDLLGVKNRVPLQKGNIPFGFRAAKGKRLFEGQPDRGGITLLHRRAPQHQDVDALIRNAVPAQRAGDASRRMLSAPRLLQPRANAGFQTCDNLVCNSLVNI